MVRINLHRPSPRTMGTVLMDNCTTRPDGLQSCYQSNSNIEYLVRNVYPPIQELQPKVLAVVVVFVLCFVVGVCGNTSVLTIIRGVIAERRVSGRLKRSGDNAILYIAALCVCDFLMSLSLPPAILDSVIGFWIFGTWMCKLHHVCGSVGRIVSTFLITAMSFDRYVAVCLPHHHRLRSKTFVLCTIFLLSAAAFLLLLPMLIFASAKEMVLHELKALDSNNITRVRVFKCSDMLPTWVFYWFTSSTFIMGYIVPLVLIVYFNVKLSKKVYAHKRVLPRSAIPVRRVIVYTVLIACVYFICWTPYWCSVLYAIVMSILEMPQSTSDFVLFMIYVIHLLPYFGSSSNWILYGLLNTQLQMKSDNSNPDDHMSIITMVNTNITRQSAANRNMSSATVAAAAPAAVGPKRSMCDACRSLSTDQQAVVRYNRSKGLSGAGCRAAAAAAMTGPSATVVARDHDSDHSMHFFEETEQTLL